MVNFGSYVCLEILIFYVITNTCIVSDASILLRDMAGDAAQKASNKINPSEDQLNQIDHAAEDNTWHDTPSGGDLKGRMKDTFNKQKPLSRNDFKDAAGDASEGAGGSRDPAQVGDRAAQEGADTGDTSVDAKGGAKQGLNKLKDRASEGMPDDTKDRARDMAGTSKERSRQYLDKKMPQERRDQVIYRLKKMVVEIQGHQDCKLL